MRCWSTCWPSAHLSQQHIELTPVSLGAVVESVMDGWQTDVQEKNARVTVSGPWPVVLAHEATLAQVLGNLVGNALKFTAANDPAVCAGVGGGEGGVQTGSGWKTTVPASMPVIKGESSISSSASMGRSIRAQASAWPLSRRALNEWADGSEWNLFPVKAAGFGLNCPIPPNERIQNHPAGGR